MNQQDWQMLPLSTTRGQNEVTFKFSQKSHCMEKFTLVLAVLSAVPPLTCSLFSNGVILQNKSNCFVFCNYIETERRVCSLCLGWYQQPTLTSSLPKHEFALCIMLTCLHFSSLQHFVSERKYDEDLGRVARFTCDLDALKKSIESFGQGELVYPGYIQHSNNGIKLSWAELNTCNW